ncbi:hypothetical protein T06_17027 [Trichinella sp. T6]|nr:hypothetical protein T06_2787 [Trichinella sp. T6]KRX69405.1 hypothetical protein T06_17027 [Trichinella sp. T6]
MCIIEINFYKNEVQITEITVMKLICLFALVIATSALRIMKQKAPKKDYDFKKEKEAVIAELDQRFDGYREHCYPLPGDGCKCQETMNGVKGTYKYEKDLECKTGDKRVRLCEDTQCKTDFKKINRCRTKDKCGQDKWKPYEDCMKACTKIQYSSSNQPGRLKKYTHQLHIKTFF